LKDLVGWVWEEFCVTLSEQSMSRILRQMNKPTLPLYSGP
jgi:L,D-peptidoglycan transpeptidase YkuD (ErfK/YbiS/YcfS/YnhG family)